MHFPPCTGAAAHCITLSDTISSLVCFYLTTIWACSEGNVSVHHSQFALAAAIVIQVVSSLDSSEVGSGSNGSGSPTHSGAQQAELQLAAAWQVSFLCCPLPLTIKLCMIHIPVGSPTLLTICSDVGSTGCPTAAGTLYFLRMPSNSDSPLCLTTISPACSSPLCSQVPCCALCADLQCMYLFACGYKGCGPAARIRP